MRNLASLDLNLLVAFEALLSERSVSRAADRMGVAQPTMSGILARLRAMLEDDLLIRTPTGMVPTARAQELAEPITEALDGLRRALNQEGQEFAPQTAKRFFSIGAIDYVTFAMLEPLVRNIRREAPSVGLFIRPSKARSLPMLLDKRRIDVGIGTIEDVPKRIELIGPLLLDKLVCIAARRHPALPHGLPLKAFLELPHARRAHSGRADRLIDDELARTGHTRPVVLVLPSWHTVGITVAASDVLAVVPESAARALAMHFDIAVHDVPLELEPRAVNLAWSSDRGSDPGIAWLRERILEAAESSSMGCAHRK
jgi:DNA-binding transcriptional LysR family regulator